MLVDVSHRAVPSFRPDVTLIFLVSFAEAATVGDYPPTPTADGHPKQSTPLKG